MLGKHEFLIKMCITSKITNEHKKEKMLLLSWKLFGKTLRFCTWKPKCPPYGRAFRLITQDTKRQLAVSVEPCCHPVCHLPCSWASHNQAGPYFCAVYPACMRYRKYIYRPHHRPHLCWDRNYPNGRWGWLSLSVWVTRRADDCAA